MKRCIVLLLLVLMVYSVNAQLSTNKISVYKNGYAYFQKELPVKKLDGEYLIPFNLLPDAQFGSYFLTNPRLRSAKTITKKLTEVKDFERSKALVNEKDVFELNKGKEVSVQTDLHSFQGEITQVHPDWLQLKSEIGYQHIRINDIRHFDFLEEPIFAYPIKSGKDTTEKNSLFLQLEFNKPKEKEKIHFQYMTYGLGWLPQYKLILDDKNQGFLKLEALVINQAEPINKTDVELVVGLPNFKYIQVGSARKQTLAFTDLLNRLGRSSGNTNDVFGDRANRGGGINSYEISNLDLGAANSQNNAVSGEAESDLFFYKLDKITLEKNHTAWFKIFETEVPVKHFYEVRIAENGQPHMYRDFYMFSNNTKNKVWHTLKLQNKSKQPWTAGPIFITEGANMDELPLSQGDLSYTSSEGDAYLQLTLAPDISVRDFEEEAERERGIKKFGLNFEKIQITGKIELKNYKSEKVELHVKRKIRGNLKTSEPLWLLANIPNTADRVNKIHEICWEITMEAGESKTINYAYEVWVQR